MFQSSFQTYWQTSTAAFQEASVQNSLLFTFGTCLCRRSAHYKQLSSLHVGTTLRCHVLISPPHSRWWQHDTRLTPAVSRVTSIAERAFSSLQLWSNTPRLHILLQIRQDVWYNSLFSNEDDRLDHQQEDPPKSPEPIGGAQAGEVLTDLLPVLISEKGPAEEEEET